MEPNSEPLLRLRVRQIASLLIRCSSLAMVCSCCNSRIVLSRHNLPYPVRAPSLLPIKPLIGTNAVTTIYAARLAFEISPISATSMRERHGTLL